MVRSILFEVGMRVFRKRTECLGVAFSVNETVFMQMFIAVDKFACRTVSFAKTCLCTRRIRWITLSETLSVVD
jgi:hypothetical protein